MKFSYTGGTVSRNKLEEAIDFHIALEPEDPLDQNFMEIYRSRCKQYKNEIDMCNKAIRQYGMQIKPKTLKNMQTKFYELTNSIKYRQSHQTILVTRQCLSQNWDGIGEWRH